MRHRTGPLLSMLLAVGLLCPGAVYAADPEIDPCSKARSARIGLRTAAT